MAKTFGEIEIKIERRMCTVNGKNGYFHCWEQYSEVIGPSYLKGGHPGGIVARVYGIVEFADGVRRVSPFDIEFCDEEHAMLFDLDKMDKEKREDDD